MYRARYRPTPRIEIEVEGDTHQKVFSELGRGDEVFGEKSCGRCDSDDITFRERVSTAKQGKKIGQKFTYYEMTCKNCGAFLEYGQHQVDGKSAGTLYPKRKIDDGGGNMVYDKSHRGWKPRFQMPTGDEEE